MTALRKIFLRFLVVVVVVTLISMTSIELSRVTPFYNWAPLVPRLSLRKTLSSWQKNERSLPMVRASTGPSAPRNVVISLNFATKSPVLQFPVGPRESRGPGNHSAAFAHFSLLGVAILPM